MSREAIGVDLVAVVKESSLFSLLREEQIRTLAKAARLQNFKRDQPIAKEGEKSTDFYLILDGLVELRHADRPVGRLGQGQFFGETALVSNSTRAASAFALRPTSCLVLSGSELRSYPAVVIKVLEETTRRDRDLALQAVVSTGQIQQSIWAAEPAAGKSDRTTVSDLRKVSSSDMSSTRIPSGARRLAAIMFTDIVGYTSMSQRNEALALQLLENHRTTLRPIFAAHNGRVVKTIGDAFLVEFPSSLQAVNCAVRIQHAIASQDSGSEFKIRVGINLGDVVESDGDIYGDAVNVASRVEGRAEPGGVCVSEQVYHSVLNKTTYRFERLAKQKMKNVENPVAVYKVLLVAKAKKSAQAED
jgi:class 3 adenylate cyclase